MHHRGSVSKRGRSILFNENVNISSRHDPPAYAQSAAPDAAPVGSDASQVRARRVTAAMLLVRSMLQQSQKEDGAERLQTVVETLEEAIMQALLSSADGSSIPIGAADSQGPHTIDEGEEVEPLSPRRNSTHSGMDPGSDSDDSDSDVVKHVEHMPEVVTALQKHLYQGTNLATLAGLLTSNTFSLKDRRVNQLFGEEISMGIRKLVINNMANAIDKLWEKFGWLLLEKLGSFEKAFRWLDKDGSGTIDRSEFIYAYVTLHLSNNFSVEDDEDEIGHAESTVSDGKEGKRRSTLVNITSDASASTQDRDSFRPARSRAGQRAQSVFAGSGTRRQSVVQPTATSNRGTILSKDAHNARLRRMVLKADAEFLFHMMHSGERGLASKEGEEDEENIVTMQHLVMRVTGLDVRSMENLRGEIMVKCNTLQGAFQDFSANKHDMSCEEFTVLFQHLFGPSKTVSLARASGSRAPSAAPSARASISGNVTKSSMPEAPSSPGRLEIATSKVAVSQVPDEVFEKQEKEVTERAMRIFKGIDTDGSGNLSLPELRHALAPYAPSTTFGIFRRRVLLQYGSFESFVSAQPSGGLSRDQDMEAFAFEFDLNEADGRLFGERLGINENTLAPEMPTDGFTVEEFAIVLFLAKPEGSTMEEILAKLGRIDRDKDMHFREFQDRMTSLMQTRPAAAKAKMASAKTRPNLARSSTLGPGATTTPSPEPTMSCRVKELRAVYEMLEREHRRVSVNILAEAMKNISDCIAIDRTTYQTGDHMVCRIRLSADLQKKCRDRPFIAVVPERLKWQESGTKGQWNFDGRQVHELTALCGKVHEIQRTPSGVARRESWLRLIVPSILACAERYEVRLFSSTNGKEPGKQIGRSVPFDLLMPRPESPLVDQVSLDTCGAEEASVVLHWTPPLGNFKSSPITSFIVHVEPLIYRHEISVDKMASAKEVKEDSESESDPDDDDDDTYKQVVVWSPKLNTFLKKLSYKIHGLQRGVQYRFGIQCVHATTKPQGNKDPTQSPVSEVRGALSELSDVITMPLYHVTSAPGKPEAHQLANGVIELAWAVPVDEDEDTNRIFQYLIQYRHANNDSDAGSGRRHSSSSERSHDEDGNAVEDSDEDSDDDNSELHHDGHTGSSDSYQGEQDCWLPVPDKVIFVGQPQWLNDIGWVVPCHIPELMMIDGVQDSLPHEFRICSVNNAGKSAWSTPSEPIQLRSVFAFQTTPPPPVERLEVVEVSGHQASGKSELRSQCKVRWELPAVLAELPDAPTYELQVRDMSPTTSSVMTSNAHDEGWRSVEFYLQSHEEEEHERRRSARSSSEFDATQRIRDSMLHQSPKNSVVRASRRDSMLKSPQLVGQLHRESFVPQLASNVRVDAYVMGLERFPASACLELRVQVVTPGGAGSCTVEIPAMEAAQLEPPETAPDVVQLIGSLSPIVELQFSPARHLNGQGSEVPRYVVQASYTANWQAQEAEDESGWSEFADVDDICLSPYPIAEGGQIKCIVRNFGSDDGLYRFRICTVSADGTRSKPSPFSEEPLEFRIGDLSFHAVPSQPKVDEDTKPKRARDVQVVRAEQGWCELAWEQRVATGASAPSKFEVQECREDASNNEVWRDVRSVYVASEEVASDGTCLQMSAAVFFAEDPGEKRRSILQTPRWKVRVRAEGADWSAATPWQELSFTTVPPQTSSPSIVKNDLRHFALEWSVPEADEDGSIHELQLQVKQTRRGGKVSDWVPVRSYTCPLPSTNSGKDDAEPVKRFGALVDRHDVAEVAHATPDSEVRFRVRLKSSDGVCGMPSEPSELTTIRFALSSVPAPRTVDVIGQGRILMDASGDVREIEFVRLQWPLPADDEGESDLHAQYDVEMTNEQDGYWSSVPGILMDIDREARIGTALVPLQTELGVQNHSARFRVMASHGKAPMAGSGVKGLLVEAPASYSDPSPTVSWGGAIVSEAPPVVVLAQPMLLAVQFRLPPLAAHLGCSVSAMLEVSREGQDLEDDASDASSKAELDFAGEHPVYFQIASVARRTSRSSLTGNEFPVGMDLAVFDKERRLGTLCDGVVMINVSQALTVGDKVRARLRVCPSGLTSSERLQVGALSQSSLDILVQDVASSRNTSLRIEYPSWTSLVPVGAAARFPPRLFFSCAEDPDALEEWHEAATGGDGKRLLQFRIADGVLPLGLALDVNTGVISGMCPNFEILQSFTVHASVIKAWPLPSNSGQSTAVLAAGAAATATLACAVVDRQVHSTLCELLDSSLLEKLHEQGGTIAIGQLLNSPAFLPIYDRLCAAAAAAEGDEQDNDPVVEAIQKVSRLPKEAVQLISDLGEEEFLLRLYGDDSDESSEEESEMQEEEESEEEQQDSPDEEKDEEEEEIPDDDIMLDEDCNNSDKAGLGKTWPMKADNGENRRESGLLPPTSPTKRSRRRHSTHLIPTESTASHDARLSVVLEFGSGSQSRPMMFGDIDGDEHEDEQEEGAMTQTMSGSGMTTPRSSSRQKLLSPNSGSESPSRRKNSPRETISRVKRRHSNIIHASAAFAEGGRSPNGDGRRKSVQDVLANMQGVDMSLLGHSFSDANFKFHTHDGAVESDSRRGSRDDVSVASSRLHDRRESRRVSDVSVDGIANLTLPKKVFKDDRRRSRILSQGSVQKVTDKQKGDWGNSPAGFMFAEGEEGDEGGGSKFSKFDANRRKSMNVKPQVRRRSGGMANIPRVEITYPGLTPLWPAFVDVEFTPVVRYASQGSNPLMLANVKQKKRGSTGGAKKRGSTAERNSLKVDMELSPEPGLLKFSIEPALPSQVMIDEFTGIISGSPMQEHVAGSQYTITANWIESGELAGRCAIAFAVVSTDLANLCNNAYLGQEPPAFRPSPAHQTHAGQESAVSHNGPSNLAHWNPEPQAFRQALDEDMPPLPCDATQYSSSATADDLIESMRNDVNLSDSRCESRNTPSRSACLESTLQPTLPSTPSPARCGIGGRGPGAGRSHTPGPFMVPARPRSSTPVDQPVARASTSMGGCFQSRLRPGSSLEWCPRPASRSMMTPVDDRRTTSSPWRSRFAAGFGATPDLVRSRTKVFPLGPPLKDRDGIYSRSTHGGGEILPWSARY